MPAYPQKQRRITLRSRPKAAINLALGKNDDGTFLLEEGVEVQLPKQGELLVRVGWVSISSVDPAMRGWLNDSRSYIEPVQIKAVMRAAGVGQVVAVGGGTTKAQVGDWVSGLMGWQEYATVTQKDVQKILVKKGVSPTSYLGVLGSSGLTAYFGITDIMKIKEGETVVLTGAAGSVGIVACQLAKLKGCKVIAVAGGPEKCKYLRELGADVALDYKSSTFVQDFRKVGYVHAVFDNVGGDILDMILTRLQPGARIALCGAISAYNDPSPKGLKNYLNLISQRAKIQGFIVFDYAQQYGAALKELSGWVEQGKLKSLETEVVGLENCVEALVGLFKGANTGKAIVRIGGEGEGRPKL